MMEHIEQAIAQIWAETLQRPLRPASDENFFALGGDSLAAMIVLFRIGADLGIDVSVDALIAHPTLQQFCSHVCELRLQVREEGAL